MIGQSRPVSIRVPPPHGVALLPRPSLPLEPVVFVQITSVKHRDDAGPEVGRNEQRSPPLALLNMHSLVTPGPIEAIRVPPEDDMAEGQRRSSAPERHYPLQEAAGETAVHFENTIDDLDVTFRYDRDHGAQQPEDCNGERPGVREPAYGRASCEPDRALPRAEDASRHRRANRSPVHVSSIAAIL